MSKLIWNQIDGELWQAGGLTRSFSIIAYSNGGFSLRARTGDNPSIHVGVFTTLKKAQSRAQAIHDKNV
jgi:hypothetical protein